MTVIIRVEMFFLSSLNGTVYSLYCSRVAMGINTTTTSFINNKLGKAKSGHEGQFGFIFETVDGGKAGKEGKFPK
jgi:hypothetical protein